MQVLSRFDIGALASGMCSDIEYLNSGLILREKYKREKKYKEESIPGKLKIKGKMIREGKYTIISYGRNKVVVFPILRLIELVISSVFRQFLNLYLLTTFNI